MHTEKSKKAFSEKWFAAIIVATAVVAIVYCFSGGISGNDYWWHIKLGEHIWMQKSIPTTDLFSWYGTMHGIKCTVHEWLADVLFYLIQHVFGAFGIFMLSFFLAVVLVLLSIKVVGRRLFQNVVFSGLFFSLFAVLTTLFFYGRPHIFSIYLFFAEIYCLHRYYHQPESKCIWFIPAIGCLWSNLHGGSSNLSYLLCILFLVCGAVKIHIGKLYAIRMPRGWLKTLLLITGLTIASVLVNPIGFSVFIYPYVNMGNAFMLSVVSEWAAPDAKNSGHLILYFLPVFMVVVSLILTEKRVALLNLVMLLFFAILFFRSIRFIIFFYIAAVFFAFSYFPKWKMKEIKGKLEKAAVLLFLAFIGLGILFGVSKVIPKVSAGTLISVAVSDEAIQAVKAENPERIFNDYNFGEALIYHDIPVFFDSRADLYAENNILKDGISLLHLQSAEGEEVFDVDAMMDKYRFDGYFISASRPLYTYLVSHPERFLLVYADGNAGYFKVR